MQDMALHSVERDAVAGEYLGKALERHNQGASENDICSAFRDFLVRTEIAGDESEIVTETRPAADSRHKVDLYLRNTYVEFKRSIIKGGGIDPDAIAQLDGYLLENARAGNGIQNGILTDGKHFLKRTVGDCQRPADLAGNRRLFDKPEQGIRLYEYLCDIIDTQAEDIEPSADNLLRDFGQEKRFLQNRHRCCFTRLTGKTATILRWLSNASCGANFCRSPSGRTRWTIPRNTIGSTCATLT